MSEAVKPKRRYRSKRRELQAEETKQAILRAAKTLFTANGWSATSIATIADRAGVAPETIYARFGNKRAILQALVVSAMRGAEPATPFMEQVERRRVSEQTEPSAMIDAFSHDITEILRRVSPILGLVRSAAETDDEMGDLYVELHAARRRNLGHFVERLRGIGGLRQGLSQEEATGHVWLLVSPELFLVATTVGGRDAEDYRAWLAEALRRLLT